MKLNLSFKHKILCALNRSNTGVEVDSIKVVLVKLFKGTHVEYVVWNVDKECNCNDGSFYAAWARADEPDRLIEARREFLRRCTSAVEQLIVADN